MTERFKRTGRGKWSRDDSWKKINSQSQTTFMVNNIVWEGQPHVNVKVLVTVAHPTTDQRASVWVRASVPIDKDDYSWRSALKWMNDAWKDKFGTCFRVDMLFQLNGPQVYLPSEDSPRADNVLHIVEGEVSEPDFNITTWNLGKINEDGSFTGDLVLADDDMLHCREDCTIILGFKSFETPFEVTRLLPEGATQIDCDAWPNERQKKSWASEHEVRFKGSNLWIPQELVQTFPNWMQVLASRPNVTVYKTAPKKCQKRKSKSDEPDEAGCAGLKRLKSSNAN